ncbi:c-type cytochrome [Pontibacter cellulosilyticus]|uniref:Cytochrome c n=1 Tax=Pontibacter cellulosilyticus TaxID=1720253 RepID=A0A923SHG9_9BACT|nr:cytochrome c [Pontibacter cellulosilyticus]MBC5991537.1 cytochrome c [Pontibacter cellulosilyticus]
MIKRIAKITLKVLVLIVTLSVFAYLYLFYSLNARIEKAYAIEPRAIAFNTDVALLVQGEHLYTIKGCADCHGPDLGGKVMFDDLAVGVFGGSNITYGEGGLPKDYTSKDWLRALRHGINKESKPLLIMPSQEIYKLSDKDISALIAYCMNQPPVNNKVPPVKLRPLGTILSALGQIPLISAEHIDHAYTAPVAVEALPNAVYGEYLAVSCSGCHKQNFKGGKSEVPGMKPYPDITASGSVDRWSEQQFIQTLRTGTTPEGKQMKNEEMPWQMTKAYTDTELKALYVFLKQQ